MLAAHHLRKTYGDRMVVEDVSLFVRRGEAVGLLGPNGAGKTTTFSMVIGVVQADAGDIYLDGVRVTRMPQFERARRGMSYLPQEPSIFRSLTVEQNILLVLEVHEGDRKRRQVRLDALIGEFGLDHVRRSPAGALSGGERRRCEIARSLASDPSFVLLDEPFAGVDPLAVSEIRLFVRFLTDRGIGVLITDHNVRETLNLIDRAYIIESGRVLAHGTVEDVVSSVEVQRAYLGLDFRL